MAEPCVFCEGTPLPEEQQGEGHVSVRFGSLRFVVLLNGEDVSSLCPEAFAGEDGWVLLYGERDTLRIDLKTCLDDPTHPRTIMRHGRVDIRLRLESLPRG